MKIFLNSRVHRAAIGAIALATISAVPAIAQRGGGRGGNQVEPAAQAVPQAPGSAAHIRTGAPTDPVIQQMWVEGTQRSQVMKLAQQLTDSIGARLTGSPDMERAQQWPLDTYGKWGITARREQYGTWNAWRKGVAHLDLIAPRVRSLEISTMSWSHSTNGQTLEGEVAIVPASVTNAEQFTAWLPSVRGKIVLTSPARLSCRMTRQWQEFGTQESQTELAAMQRAADSLYNRRVGFGGGAQNISAVLKNAGALGVLATNWSQYPGINKIFGSPRQQLPTLDVGCEDYGLLFRLAENNQRPRARMFVDAELLGEKPVFNVIAEIKGVEKPNEYVMLSAHFDSHGGSSGATDNATGSMTMMEAMRILKATYPRPKRTILVGHWSGEEQGLNGSRAYAEDHPEVVAGLQVLWNQDNGTGRVVNMGPGPFSSVRPVLERYLSQIPSDITQWIRLGNANPGPATGGSDHAGFQCKKAPGLSLGALSWDYSNTTWHTNRDTYDKIIPYDLRNNAMLTAMLTYLASEDPQKMARDVLPMPADSTGRIPRVAGVSSAHQGLAAVKPVEPGGIQHLVNGPAQTIHRAGPVSSVNRRNLMKTLRLGLLSFALIVGSATLEAQTPPPPTPPKPEQPAFDPVGYYELQVTFGGQPVAIVLEMWKENGAWKGSAGNAQLGFTNVTAVTQEGRDLRVTLVAENGPTFNMRISVKTDNTVTGVWEGNGDGSPITGKKTK